MGKLVITMVLAQPGSGSLWNSVRPGVRPGASFVLLQGLLEGDRRWVDNWRYLRGIPEYFGTNRGVVL